ncbi:hypothetical protein Maes01_02492 [Microbulbifer aestuariivivens]|uniref:DUF4304 domain-containing protein n=1 Tax=Microbulbifer aestuariivivens TaxID=1908308 RepID=A0ABP9WRU6_9GAMM
MTFKRFVVDLAKKLKPPGDGWKFTRSQFRRKINPSCVDFIDPVWTFEPYGAVSFQPVVGLYLPEVEDIWVEVSGYKRNDNFTFFNKIPDASAEKAHITYTPTLYQNNYSIESEIIDAACGVFNIIFLYAEEYFSKIHGENSTMNSIYSGVIPKERGNQSLKFAIVRGLLGDVDYIERYCANEIDPEGPKDFEIANRIREYFNSKS